MALEQMRTFLAGGTQEKLGGVTLLPPDNHPLLLTSDLRPEHEAISVLIETAGPIQRGSEIRSNPTLLRMCEADRAQRTRYCLALIERTFAYDAKLACDHQPATARQGRVALPNPGVFDFGPPRAVISVLVDRGAE